MHPIKKFIASAAALALVDLLSTQAFASQPFPAALQEAAGMPCAPSCVICHGVDPGTAGTFTKKALGAAMFSAGATKPDASLIKTAWATYSAKPENAANVTAIKAGIDPETGADLCSSDNKLTYGCGAHIVKETPRDDWSGLLFVAGAMGFGALLRRTKRR